MDSSWEKVILSWINTCGVCTEQIEDIDDLKDANIISCLLPCSSGNLDSSPTEKLSQFIEDHYPGFWEQMPSPLGHEDILIISSLLIHYYSFIEDTSIRNKMCALSNDIQLQLRSFLQQTLNKDVTKETLQMAIKSSSGNDSSVEKRDEICETTPKIKSRRKSSPVLQEFLNSPVAKQQKRHTEIRKLQAALQSERDERIFLEAQLEEMKKQNEQVEVRNQQEIKILQQKLQEAQLFNDPNTNNSNSSVVFANPSDLNFKIRELREVIDCLNEKCSNLSDDNSSLKVKVASLHSQLLDSKSKINNLETSHADAQLIIAKHIQKNLELEQELSEMKSEMNSLTITRSSEISEANSDNTEDLLPSVIEEPLSITVVDKLLKEQGEKVLELEERVESLESDLKCKESQLSKEEEHVASLKEELIKKVKENEEFELKSNAQISQLSMLHDSLVVRLKECDSMYLKETERVHSLQQKMSLLEALVSEKELEIAQLSENVRKQNEINNENNSTILLLRKELKEVSESYSNECDSLKKEIEKTRGVVIEKEIQIHSLHKTIESKTCDFDFKLAELERVTYALQLSNDKIDEKQECIDQLENQLQHLLLKNESLKNEVESFNEKLLEQTINVCNLQEEVTRKEEFLLEKTDEIEKLLSALQVKEKSCCETEEKIIFLEKQLIANKENFSTECSNLKQEIENNVLSLQEKEEKLSILENNLLFKEEELITITKELSKSSEALEVIRRDKAEKEIILNALQNQLRTLNYEHKNLMNEYSMHTRKLQIMEEHTAGLKQENASLETLLVEKTDQIHKQSETLKQNEIELYERQQNIVALENELSALKESFTFECNSLRKEINDKQAKILELERLCFCKEKELEVKENHLYEKDDELKRFSEALELANEISSGRQKTIQMLEDRINSLCTENESLKSNIEDSNNVISRVRSNVSDLRNEIAEKNLLLTQKEEEIATFSQEVKDLEREKLEKNEIITSLRDEMKLVKDTLGSKCDSLIEQIQNNEIELCRKEESLSVLENKILCKEEELDFKINELVKFSKTIDELSIENKEKQEMINSLQEKLINLENLFDVVQRKVTERDERLNFAESKIVSLRKELDLKSEQLDSKEAEIENLTTSFQKIEEENLEMQKVVKTSLQQLQAVQKSCEMEKENLRKDIEAKEILLKEKTERERDLEKELAAKDRTLVEKVEAIAVLSNKIESMDQSMQNSIEKQDSILIILEEQKQLHNSLTVENEELKRTLVKNEACLLDKDDQISKYVGKIEVLEKEINDQKDVVINLFNKITLLDEELSQKQETIHNLKGLISLVDKIKSENELLKNQKIEVETKLLNLEKNTDELSNKCQEMECQLLERKKAIDDLQIQVQEHNSSQKEISDLKEKLENLEVVKAKYTELKVKYFEVVKECQNMKSKYDEKLAKLKEQMHEFYNKNLEEVKSQHSSSTAETLMSLNVLREKYSQCHGDNVELRRQLWELKENLLSATNENKKLRARLSVASNQSQALGELEQQVADRRGSQYRRASERHPQIGVMDVIEESITFTRRRTRSSETPIPPGFGQAFPPQDEQGEEFNAKYLDDMMEGRCNVGASGTNRLTEFQHRNSMVLPHLKSSYPVIESRELLKATEDDVKFGHVGDGDNFDTLSTSLLLPDKRKNKDRGQTSYKKPGPPTPGKNGGRLSQQGLEQRTTPHSILREQNDNSLSRKGVTPNRLKMFFSSKTNRKDENSPATPRTRGLGFFKKTTKSRNHPF